MIKHKRKPPVGKIVSIGFIGIMLMVTYIPIMVLMVYSFTDARTLGTWTGFTLKLYEDMFSNNEIMTALGNSLLIALVSSTIATFIGTAAAVGVFYMRKFPKAAMNGVTQITLVNADIVTGIGFMLFFVVVRFIPEGYLTLIIAHTTICIPYVVMSVMPRLSQLNPHVYEAGLDLGATHMRTFFTVVLPQLVSGMIAGFMLAFTISLDDFVISKYINGTVTTIPVYLYNKLAKRGVDPTLRALSSILLVTVMLILIVINIGSARRQKKLANLKIS